MADIPLFTTCVQAIYIYEISREENWARKRNSNKCAEYPGHGDVHTYRNEP